MAVCRVDIREVFEYCLLKVHESPHPNAVTAPKITTRTSASATVPLRSNGKGRNIDASAAIIATGGAARSSSRLALFPERARIGAKKPKPMPNGPMAALL